MKSQDILSAVGSYEKSRIILTACELDLFTQIHQNPNTARELATTNALNLEATKRLLDCLVTFDLLIKKNDQYIVTAGGMFLADNSPENILFFIRTMNKSWNNWHNLTEIVKNGRHTQKENERKSDEGVDKDFIELMHLLGRQLSSEIATIYNLSPFSKMLDIGGASGTYTISFLKKNPDLKATLYDLEVVLPLAEVRLRSEGLLDRVELRAGDYNKDTLPEGYDLVLLSDVIGQNTNKQNVCLFKKIHESLKPGGVLLIRDFVMDETHTNPKEGALFSMLMLVETSGVGAYSFPEYRNVLEEAGFSDINLVKKGRKKNSLVDAKKT
ncbi:methyltransferase [Desulfococcaceae bacterium HSG8]|nr:methyltransferase [Desulfococcaceae bacterium HSG8]